MSPAALALFMLIAVACGAPAGLQVQIDAFHSWMAASGGDMSRVEVFQSPKGGLGLRATKPIPKGSDIIYVPANLTLEESTGRASDPTLSKAFDVMYDTFDKLGLKGVSYGAPAMQFVYEKWYNPNSIFGPFLDLLPEKVSQHYSFWTPEYKGLLNHMWGFRQEIVVESYAEAFPQWATDLTTRMPEVFGSPSPGNLQLLQDRLLHGTHIARTYTFGPRKPGQGNHNIAGIAFMNHVFESIASHYYVSVEDPSTPLGYAVGAAHDIQPGEEVHVAYVTGPPSSCGKATLESWGMVMMNDTRSQCAHWPLFWFHDKTAAGKDPRNRHSIMKMVSDSMSFQDLSHFADKPDWHARAFILSAADTVFNTEVLQFFRVSTGKETEVVAHFNAGGNFNTSIGLDSELAAAKAARAYLLPQLSNAKHEMEAVRGALPANPADWSYLEAAAYDIAVGVVASTKHALHLLDEHWLAVMHGPD